MRKTTTSVAVKTRYQRSHYDRLTLLLPKGSKEKLQKYAEEKGVSVNSIVNQIGRELVGASEAEWKPILA